MPSGRLASAALAATTNTTVYTVPATKTSTVNVNLCNRTSSTVTIRMALSTSDTPADADWIEYDVTIPGNGVLERSALRMAVGDRIVVWSDTGSAISVVVFGIEGDV